jgi:hypothetical protein
MSIISINKVPINAPYSNIYSALEEIGATLQLMGYDADLSPTIGRLGTKLNIGGAVYLNIEVLCFSKSDSESHFEVKAEFEQVSDFMKYLTGLNSKEAERICDIIVKSIINKIDKKSNLDADLELLKPKGIKQKLALSYLGNSIIYLVAFLIVGYFLNRILNS